MSAQLDLIWLSYSWGIVGLSGARVVQQAAVTATAFKHNLQVPTKLHLIGILWF